MGYVCGCPATPNLDLIGADRWRHSGDLVVQSGIDHVSVVQRNVTVVIAHPRERVLTPVLIHGLLLLTVKGLAEILQEMKTINKLFGRLIVSKTYIFILADLEVLTGMGTSRFLARLSTHNGHLGIGKQVLQLQRLYQIGVPDERPLIRTKC